MISEKQLRDLYRIYRDHPAVTTDSRNVPEGSLFFALRGENFDGNRFVAAALKGGAAYAVADSRLSVAESYPEGIPGSVFFVDDVLQTLQALARMHRREMGIPVLAITGTNGKTTTKELCTAVLSAKYRVHSTAGNLNNHIGVPLTLLSMKPGAELAIIEMGASARGEIAELCSIACPDYGIVTNIGRAHLEGFGGEEGIRIAKGELYDYLASSGGGAILRNDDPVLASMASERPGMKIFTYDASWADGMKTELAGSYNRFNIAAAVAAGRLFEVPDSDIVTAVEGYKPRLNRSQKIDTGRNTIIADCYNANPSSMKAAIQNFISEQGSVYNHKIMILGDMYELGQWSGELHREVVRMAAQAPDIEVWFIGRNFSEALSAPEPLDAQCRRSFPDTGTLMRFIEANPVEATEILIKGSRAMSLEKIIPLF